LRDVELRLIDALGATRCFEAMVATLHLAARLAKSGHESGERGRPVSGSIALEGLDREAFVENAGRVYDSITREPSTRPH
jgi:hypothetical protein